jgi:hypothetical protein
VVQLPLAANTLPLADLGSRCAAVALGATSLIIFVGLTLGTGQLLHLSLDRSGKGGPFGEAWSSTGFYGGTTVFDLFREAIAVFSSGEAELVLEQVVSSVTAAFAPKLEPVAPPSVFSLGRILDLFRSVTIAPPALVAPPTLLHTLKDRFLLGLAGLGTLGSIGTIIGSSAMPLISMLNTLRLPIPFLGGAGRRRGANGARQGPGIGAALIVTLVVFGGVKCVVTLINHAALPLLKPSVACPSVCLTAGSSRAFTSDSGGRPSGSSCGLRTPSSTSATPTPSSPSLRSDVHWGSGSGSRLIALYTCCVGRLTLLPLLGWFQR